MYLTVVGYVWIRYVIQVLEVSFVNMHDAGCKTTQLRVKVSVMESDTDHLQWYFIRSKISFDLVVAALLSGTEVNDLNA